MCRKHPPFLLLLVLLLAFPLAANAQEKAQLPYAMVNSYLELFKSLEHLDQIVPSMMISSTTSGVKPEDIELKIKVPTGWETFSPDNNDVVGFPYEPEWADSILISNQPRGTLQLLIGYSARRLGSTRLSYQELMGLVPQFEEALTVLAEKQGEPPPKVKGLTIQLPESSPGTVRVLSQKRTQTLKPNSTGIVVIKYKDALWQENPPVEFDHLPVGIVPLQ